MKTFVCTLGMLVLGAAAGLLLQAQSRPASAPSAPAGTSCDKLAQLTIPGAAIASAEAVPAGQFEPEPGRAFKVPPFCRVKAVATPSADSHINIEVWLPAAGEWNTRFLGVGNGGFSGSIGYPAMASAVGRGYATAGTDTGHTGDQMEFGQGYPERIVDWAYRSIHLTAEIGKLVARNHYGRFPAHSYFNSCSTGGQQALSEAQRFPGDYDGIVAGAPANNRIRLILGFLWGWNAAHREDGTAIIAQRDLALVARASVAACDGADGLEDGIISDPRSCRFDPADLRCTGERKDACLGPEQVEAFQKIYSGARHARTGEQIYPGWTRGSEAGWQQYLTGPREPARVGLFRHFVFHNPDWDPRSFDWDRDVAYVESQVPHLSALSLDYTAFRNRGGRLLAYTGLADPVIPAEEPTSYYEKVVKASGGLTETQKFFRFFPVPGMGHCGGGEAPNTFDAQAAIEAWVEKGTAPAQLLATQHAAGKIVRSRPLCPFPQVAKHRGGPIEDAASFACAAR